LKPIPGRKDAVGRLFVLELSGGRIHSVSPDGSSRKIIISDCHFPDGIVVDAGAGHIYWTNMGVPNLNDGSIERADLDGGRQLKGCHPPGRHFHAKAALPGEGKR
jgi:sugar lactone lactonase YvrE